MTNKKFSNPCLYVGEELTSFVNKMKTVNKKSFSRSLLSIGIYQADQAKLNLKYNFDSQLRIGSVYLPFFDLTSGDLITYGKYKDNKKLEMFEVSSSDLNYLYCSINPNLSHDLDFSTLIIVKDFSDLFLSEKIISALSITNVYVVYYKGTEFNVVHEQFKANHFLFLNFEDRKSINLNLQEINKIGFSALKNKFLSLLIENLKALHDEN